MTSNEFWLVRNLKLLLSLLFEFFFFPLVFYTWSRTCSLVFAHVPTWLSKCHDLACLMIPNNGCTTSNSFCLYFLSSLVTVQQLTHRFFPWLAATLEGLVCTCYLLLKWRFFQMKPSLFCIFTYVLCLIKFQLVIVYWNIYWILNFFHKFRDHILKICHLLNKIWIILENIY